MFTKLALVCIMLFALTRDSAAADIPSTQPAEYFGQVIAPDGKPVAGAIVHLIQMQPDTRAYATVATAATDSAGKFKVTGNTPGAPVSWALVRAPGLALTSGSMEQNSASKPFEFHPKPATEVRVTFVDTVGNPVPGVRVWPSIINEAGPSRSIDIPTDLRNQFAQVTDASGSCVFKDLPSGGTLDYAHTDARFARPIGQERILLAAAPVTPPVTRKLEVASSIIGKLTFADSGRPASGITVTASGTLRGPGAARTTWTRTATTDADGVYTMRNLHFGQYTIRATLPTVHASKYAAPEAESFELRPAEQITSKDISIVSGGIVTGKVTAAGTGEPVPNARISVRRMSSPENPPPNGVLATDLAALARSVAASVAATTDANGTYSFHVLPGEIQVDVTGPPTGFTSLRPATRPTLTIAENQTITQDFELSLSSAPALSGSVVDEAGQPVAGASILLDLPANPAETGAPRSQQVRSDPSGHFTAASVPAGALVRARSGSSGTRERIFVAENNRNDLKLTLQKDAMASAAVVISDINGKPIAGASLSLSQRLTGTTIVSSGGTTGVDGKVIIQSLYPDANYSLSASAAGYARGNSIPLQVQSGKQTDVQFQLVKADSFVSGMVLDENQLPMANMDVYVTSARSGSQTVKTDITGHFRAEGITPGDTVNIFTRVNNRSLPPERIAAGTTDAIFIHNPANLRQPATLPAGRGR